MRQKLKQPVLLLLAIVLLFSTVNCTKDSFEDIQNLELNEEILTSKSPFLVDYLSADQAPVFVKEMFPSRNTASNVTSTNSYIDAKTGAVFDEQTIMKVTDTLGNTNYTIRFGFPHTPERIFYNLIVGRDAQGVMNEPYIVRYVSDSTAFAAFKDSNYNFSKFRGKITYHKYVDFFGTDKSLIGDLVVVNRANRRGQATIDAQTSCPTEFDEFGDPVACETLTLDGGTSGSTGGSSGSGEGLPSGGTAGDDAGVDPSPPPGDGSTSDGSDGTREPEDPIDNVGPPCCNLGGGATLGGGTYVPLDGGTGGSDGGGSGAGCLRWVGVEIICDAVGENCVAKSIYVPAECTVGTQTTNTFEECPECPTPTDGGAGILIPKVLGGGGTEETTSDDEQIVNNLTGKADCVYQKLLNSSTGFANAVKKFDGEFPVANLKFNLADLADGERGRTIPPGHPQNPDPFLILIQLNNDSSISGVNFRPNLLTAKTIIHEVIHAEMFRKLMELAGSNGSIDTSILRTMLEQGDYPGMLDYYTRFGLNGFQHQQMAQHYRETIARSLQEFDTGLSVPSGQQPLQLYMDLAWEGLNHSNILAWNKAITQEERNRIDQVIANYIQEHKNENCQ